jgi:hypothetical protein
LSGVSERAMIVPVTNTSRPKRRYDHRLRDLVQRTGDLTIATDLGVPRSTARGWLGCAYWNTVSVAAPLRRLRYGRSSIASRRAAHPPLPCSTRASSWSAHARRCTWKSRAPTPAGRRPSLETPASPAHAGRRVSGAWLSQAWSGWRSAVHIVNPDTRRMAPAPVCVFWR